MEICAKTFHNDIIEKILKSHLNIHEDVKIFFETDDVSHASDGLTGFQAEYFKLAVTVAFHNQRTKVYFFIKSLPYNQKKAMKLTEVGFFHKEINIYNIIFPQFKRVQRSTNYIMSCLYSSHTDVIFEDLNIKGYEITDARRTFDREHCIVALKSLAQFHAASIILEETKKKELNYEYTIEEAFKNILTKCGYTYSGWYIVCMNAALVVAGESEKYGKASGHYAGVQERWSDVFKDTTDLAKPSKTERNVLCHRDLWANNLMFNFDENNKPNHCIFVDFQVCLCMPPAADVVSLLYLNLSSYQRKEMFNDLIHFYYQELGKELYLHQIDISNVIRWIEFEESCELYKKWGLIQCMCLHQLGLMEPKYAETLLENPEEYERIINVGRDDEILYKVQNDRVYAERYLDSIDDLIESYIVEKIK